MQPRIEGVRDERAGWFTRLVFWLTRRKVKRKVGKPVVSAPVRVFAHNGRMLMAYGAFESFLEGASRVSERLKSLASLRAATLVGCPF